MYQDLNQIKNTKINQINQVFKLQIKSNNTNNQIKTKINYK